MISTGRHLEYAAGYVALGLFDQADAELEAVRGDDRSASPVLEAWIELHMATKSWTRVIEVATRLVKAKPSNEHGWIGWGYALRELQRLAEALAVLQRGVLIHGEKHAVFHYNLACYHCVLGDLVAARRCLSRACEMEASFKEDALNDPDLRGLSDTLGKPSG